VGVRGGGSHRHCSLLSKTSCLKTLVIRGDDHSETTESQNPGMAGVSRDLCGSPSPVPCPSRVTQSRLHRTLNPPGSSQHQPKLSHEPLQTRRRKEKPPAPRAVLTSGLLLGMNWETEKSQSGDNFCWRDLGRKGRLYVGRLISSGKGLGSCASLGVFWKQQRVKPSKGRHEVSVAQLAGPLHRTESHSFTAHIEPWWTRQHQLGQEPSATHPLPHGRTNGGGVC